MMVRKLTRTILACIVALFLLVQFGVALFWIAGSLAPLAENPSRSYDDKMRIQLGKYYDLIQFVQKQTPRDAILLIDSPSHINTDLYFLHPRRIFYDRDLVARTQSVDYIVLTGDVPPPNVQGTRIMLDDQRGLIRFR